MLNKKPLFLWAAYLNLFLIVCWYGVFIFLGVGPLKALVEIAPVAAVGVALLLTAEWSANPPKRKD